MEEEDPVGFEGSKAIGGLIYFLIMDGGGNQVTLG